MPFGGFAPSSRKFRRILEVGDDVLQRFLRFFDADHVLEARLRPGCLLEAGGGARGIEIEQQADEQDRNEKREPGGVEPARERRSGGAGGCT